MNFKKGMVEIISHSKLQMKKPSMPHRKRMSLPKAKKIVAKSQAKKRFKQLDTYFLRAKMNVLLTPTQGVSVANYLQAWFPLSLSTSSYDWTKSADYVSLKYQYDQVRVNKIKVVVTPRANVFDQANAQNDANLTLVGDGLIHTAIDRDSQTPTNVPALTRYGSYQKYSLNKKFTRVYGVKWPKGVWLDCGSEYADPNILKEIGALGGIGMYAENFPEDKLEVWNEPYANATIYYDLVLRGKITPNTGTDASGNVILYRPSDINIAPASPAIVTAGALNGYNRRLTVDLSGNNTGATEVVDEFVNP